jgi:Tfp pilus assembly protein PilO
MSTNLSLARSKFENLLVLNTSGGIMELLIVLIVGSVTGLGVGYGLCFFLQQKSLNKKDGKINQTSAAFKKERYYSIQLEEIQKIKEYRVSELQKILESRWMALEKFEEFQLNKLQKLEESYRDLSSDKIVTIQAVNGGSREEY